jgi:hypothetical protein
MSDVIGTCRSCDKVKRVFDVGAFDSSLFCKRCIQRYGAQEIRETANAALAMRSQPKQKFCLRCGDPSIEGGPPMCTSCSDVYREKFGRPVRWGPSA